MNAVRAVLFDAVGTLIHAHPTVAEVYHRVGWEFGCRLEREDIAARFREALYRSEKSGQTPAAPSSERRERDFWRDIVRRTLDDGACDVVAAFETLWQHFARPSSWSLYDDVIPTWSRLQQSGVTIGIASNFDARLSSVIAGLPPLEQCSHVYFSSSLGCAKPDPRFFREIERRLGLSPESLLLVGDDLRNDHDAARAAGWQALWLNRRDKKVIASPRRTIDNLEHTFDYLA